MSYTAQDVIDAVRAQINEVVADRHIKDTELLIWINDELRDLSRKLKFLQSSTTLSAPSYIPTLGSTPKFYELPDDFLAIDDGAGIKYNNMRRLPTSGQQYDSFQEQGLNIDGLTITDCFSVNFDGVIFHYAVEYLISSVLTLSTPGTGKACWFVPNAVDTDTIIVNYNSMHPEITAAGNTIFFPVEFKELLVLGVAIRAATKKAAVPGYMMVPENFINRITAAYARKFNEAVEYFLNKGGEKRKKMFHARQLRNMYNSRRSIVPGMSN